MMSKRAFAGTPLKRRVVRYCSVPHSFQGYCHVPGVMCDNVTGNVTGFGSTISQADLPRVGCSVGSVDTSGA